MPHYEDTIDLYDLDKDTSLALAYEAFKEFKWEVLYAGENSLSGSNGIKWRKGGEQILCKINGQVLTVRSEMVGGELTDIREINKKNTSKFIEAFEKVFYAMNNSMIEQNIKAI